MPASESICHTGTPLRLFTTRGCGQHIFRPLEPGERDIGQIGFRIAANEIKDSVSARICAGRKR